MSLHILKRIEENDFLCYSELSQLYQILHKVMCKILAYKAHIPGKVPNDLLTYKITYVKQQKATLHNAIRST